VSRKPKKKCCVSKPRCKSCPIRMLAEGTLPSGLTVRHRRLVALPGPADLAAHRTKDSKSRKKAKKKARRQAA